MKYYRVGKALQEKKENERVKDMNQDEVQHEQSENLESSDIPKRTYGEWNAKWYNMLKKQQIKTRLQQLLKLKLDEQRVLEEELECTFKPETNLITHDLFNPIQKRIFLEKVKNLSHQQTSLKEMLEKTYADDKKLDEAIQKDITQDFRKYKDEKSRIEIIDFYKERRLEDICFLQSRRIEIMTKLSKLDKSFLALLSTSNCSLNNSKYLGFDTELIKKLKPKMQEKISSAYSLRNFAKIRSILKDIDGCEKILNNKLYASDRNCSGKKQHTNNNTKKTPKMKAVLKDSSNDSQISSRKENLNHNNPNIPQPVIPQFTHTKLHVANTSPAYVLPKNDIRNENQSRVNGAHFYKNQAFHHKFPSVAPNSNTVFFNTNKVETFRNGHTTDQFLPHNQNTLRLNINNNMQQNNNLPPRQSINPFANYSYMNPNTIKVNDMTQNHIKYNNIEQKMVDSDTIFTKRNQFTENKKFSSPLQNLAKFWKGLMSYDNEEENTKENNEYGNINSHNHYFQSTNLANNLSIQSPPTAVDNPFMNIGRLPAISNPNPTPYPVNNVSWDQAFKPSVQPVVERIPRPMLSSIDHHSVNQISAN